MHQAEHYQGKQPEAFWHSVRHAKPISIGLNCALGAAELRPFLQKLSQIADCYVSVHPNAGLPNQFGEYDQTPAEMAEIIKEFGEEGLYNIVGGCCGTNAEHIEVIKTLINDFSSKNNSSISKINASKWIRAFRNKGR